jgi:hypothetical protein
MLRIWSQFVPSAKISTGRLSHCQPDRLRFVEFILAGLYFGRFCGIIYYKGMGGGGYKNGDCEKFTSFVNNQFYLSLEYYVRCESEDKIRLFFLKFLQYKDFFAYVLVEAGKE